MPELFNDFVWKFLNPEKEESDHFASHGQAMMDAVTIVTEWVIRMWDAGQKKPFEEIPATVNVAESH
jgi:hypothetical protein